MSDDKNQRAKLAIRARTIIFLRAICLIILGVGIAVVEKSYQVNELLYLLSVVLIILGIINL